MVVHKLNQGMPFSKYHTIVLKMLIVELRRRRSLYSACTVMGLTLGLVCWFRSQTCQGIRAAQLEKPWTVDHAVGRSSPSYEHLTSSF